jgi:hypothetical protein
VRCHGSGQHAEVSAVLSGRSARENYLARLCLWSAKGRSRQDLAAGLHQLQDVGNQIPDMEAFAAHHGYTVAASYEVAESAFEWRQGRR